MPDVKAQLTRKVGPLPLYAWGGVIAAAIIVYRVLVAGGGSSGSKQVTITDAFDPDALGGGGFTPDPNDLPDSPTVPVPDLGGFGRVGGLLGPPTPRPGGTSVVLPGNGADGGWVRLTGGRTIGRHIVDPFGDRPAPVVAARGIASSADRQRVALSSVRIGITDRATRLSDSTRRIAARIG